MTTNGAQPNGLGAELKRRREERSIDLQEISNATRIGVRYLRAIEQDDFNSLPGGLFTRAFIRTYARYVGMDEAKALEQYSRQTNQVVDESGRYLLATETVRKRAQERFWTTIAIVFAIILVLGVGAFAGWHFWQRTKGRLTTWVARSSSGPTGVQNTPAEQPVVQPPAANSNPSVTTPAEPATSLSGGSAEPPPRSETPPPPVETTNTNAGQATPPQTTEPSRGAPRLEVRLEATDDCWISVLSDQGDVHQETLRAGEARTFSPQHQVVVSANKPANLRMWINGNAARLPTQGSAAGRVLISTENYQQFLRR